MKITTETICPEYTRYHCENHQGFSVDVLNLGGIIQRITLPDGTDVVLGYDQPEEYLHNTFYFGATIGPYANRIQGASFQVGGETYPLAKNNGEHCLHSGPNGLHQKNFLGEIRWDRLVLSQEITQEECGFPGVLQVEIHYILGEDNSLTLEYHAKSSEDTYVNLTNHSYFNLDGVAESPCCLSHVMTLHADEFTQNNQENIPTGVISSVAETPLDFRNPKTIGQDIRDGFLASPKGYDHNYILHQNKENKEIARVQGTKTTMVVRTNSPCVQFYTGNFITPHLGKSGVSYGENSGFCLETGVYPDGMHQSDFPSPLLKAGDLWQYQTSFHFL